MRISDWSSDVCSSDLPPDRHQLRLPRSEDPLLMALAKSTGEDALETAPREVSTFGLALGNSGVLWGGGLLLVMVLIAAVGPYLTADPIALNPIQRLKDRKSTRLNSSH